MKYKLYQRIYDTMNYVYQNCRGLYHKNYCRCLPITPEFAGKKYLTINRTKATFWLKLAELIANVFKINKMNEKQSWHK